MLSSKQFIVKAVWLALWCEWARYHVRRAPSDISFKLSSAMTCQNTKGKNNTFPFAPIHTENLAEMIQIRDFHRTIPDCIIPVF